MELQILSHNTVNLKEFVSFWSQFYNYAYEELYTTRIDKKQFSGEDLIELFKWKNGGNLSAKKQNVLELIIKKLDIINVQKADFCKDTFLAEFKFMKGIIWKIYLLHIIAPREYPIFDQHVCRAFYYIDRDQKEEVPFNNSEKEKLYFDEYVPFFSKLLKDGISRKKLDEALWAFGKFLKTPIGKQYLTNK